MKASDCPELLKLITPYVGDIINDEPKVYEFWADECIRLVVEFTFAYRCVNVMLWYDERLLEEQSLNIAGVESDVVADFILLTRPYKRYVFLTTVGSTQKTVWVWNYDEPSQEPYKLNVTGWATIDQKRTHQFDPYISGVVIGTQNGREEAVHYSNIYETASGLSCSVHCAMDAKIMEFRRMIHRLKGMCNDDA